MVARLRSKNSQFSKSLFMPLTILEMEVEHLPNRDLQKIKEAKVDYHAVELYYDPVKNAITLFIAELLYRIVKDREHDNRLFDFLCASIKWLDVTDKGVANFHLVFMIRLLYFLGIYPNIKSYEEGSYFDMTNGEFTRQAPLGRHYLNKEESYIFAKLMKMTYENMSLYTFSRKERMQIINRILEYYRLHLPDFPEIKSLSVMQVLFD